MWVTKTFVDHIDLHGIFSIGLCNCVVTHIHQNSLMFNRRRKMYAVLEQLEGE